MGLIKSNIDQVKSTDSGTEAAIERLNKTLSITPTETSSTLGSPAKAYQPRDFDKEARGKVKCVMFEAALQSPAIAGLKFSTLEEFLMLVEKAADAGVSYTWR